MILIIKYHLILIKETVILELKDRGAVELKSFQNCFYLPGDSKIADLQSYKMVKYDILLYC